jgi:hypothetical protein
LSHCNSFQAFVKTVGISTTLAGTNISCRNIHFCTMKRTRLQ